MRRCVTCAVLRRLAAATPWILTGALVIWLTATGAEVAGETTADAPIVYGLLVHECWPMCAKCKAGRR